MDPPDRTLSLQVAAATPQPADFPEGPDGAAEDAVTTPFLRAGLAVVGEAFSPRGDHVLPEDEVRFAMQAEAETQADEIVVDATLPAGTTLVAGSVNEGGVFTIRTGRIRWTFTGRTRHRLPVSE